MSEDRMKLEPVGQVSLGAKSVKVVINTREIDESSVTGGIATFYVNLEHMNRVLSGDEQVTAISQLVPKWP